MHRIIGYSGGNIIVHKGKKGGSKIIMIGFFGNVNFVVMRVL